jgi:sporulation-control protein spo0M
MAKRKRAKTRRRSRETLHLAFTPAAAVTVTPASFDKFIADVDTPLGAPATTPGDRTRTRVYCQGRWAAFDISAINRVEGAEPGWGMTLY